MSLSHGAVPRGRMKEGTPRVGGGELGAIFMQNLLPSVRDCVISGDLVMVSVCYDCRALPLNCSCKEKANSPSRMAKVCVRRALVLFDVMHTIW